MTEAVVSLISISLLLIISQLSPGPDLFYVVRTSLAQGFRAACAVVTGITIGITIQLCIVCVAGRWLLEQEWSRWLLWAAAGWFLYLAWKIMPRHFRSAEEIQQEAADGEPLLRLLRQGFLCNIFNPKCTLFICGLCLGPLQAFGDTYGWFEPALVLSMALAGQAGWMLWSGLLQWALLRRLYARYSAWVDLVFALLLALMAALFVWQPGF